MKRKKKTSSLAESAFILSSCILYILAVIIITIFLVTPVQTFNLDPRIPLIKSAGAISDSYFGFSVAQHRTSKNDRRGQTVILVGAPRDQNLQPGTNRSGALYQCSLSNEITVSISILIRI